MEISAPDSLKYRLMVPKKILMGPGPANVSPRVLQALSQPILGPIDPKLFQTMDEIKEGIKYVFQTKNALTLALSGAGHSGMETIMSNLLETGDKVLIMIQGYWGLKAANIAARKGLNVKKLEKLNCIDTFTLTEIESALKSFQPKLLFVVQGESSTGICQPLEGVGQITRKYNCLLAVDSVASLGSVPIFMDKWEIDVLYTGSQKALSVPPGITPISFSSRAQKIIMDRPHEVSVYMYDIKMLGQVWGCFGEKVPRIYHHTLTSPLICGLREGLAMIVEEGLENTIKRHQNCAKLLYKGLDEMGLELFVEDEHKRFPGVTTVKVPYGVNEISVIAYLAKKYKIEILGGLGPTAGKAFRIGILGYNATPENIRYFLESFKNALNTVNSKL